MREVREKADNRDQHWALYEGQRIIGYREWKSGSVYTPGIWLAIVVLADGTCLLLEEG